MKTKENILSINKANDLNTPTSSDITYCVIPETILIDGIEHITYGIAAICNGVIIDKALDISADFDKIQSLCSLCNENNLDPIHLHDIAQDAVIE